MLRCFHSLLRVFRFGCAALFVRMFGADVHDQMWTWFN